MQRDLSSPELWAESLRASQERRIQRARRESRERIGRRGTAVALCGLAVMSGGAFAHDGGAPEREVVTSVYLDRGDRGADVRDLQQALGVRADGIFGPQTDRAVRAFQKRNGLQVDGIAGPVTLRTLGLFPGAGSSEGASSGSQGTATPSEEPAVEKQTAEKPAPQPEPQPAAEESAPEPEPQPAAEDPAPQKPEAEEPAAEEPEPEPKPEAKSEPEPEPTSDGPSPELQAIAQCESGGNPGAISSTGQYRGKYQFSRETWRGMGGEGDPASAPESEQDRRAADLYEQSGSSSWPSCG